ncbi:MAG: aminotransferase class IV [Puniceicoccaceae bacterium]
MPSRSAHPLPFVFWNNQIVPASEALLPANSPAVRYGLGCFETLRFDGTNLRFHQSHTQRLRRACQAQGFDLSLDLGELEETARTLAQKNRIDHGVARFSVHPDGDSLATLLLLEPPRPLFFIPAFKLLSADFPHPGCSPLSAYKPNNYARNLCALQQAQVAGYHDAVLCLPEKMAIETSVSNLHFLHRSVLHSPGPETGALPGIMREHLLTAAVQLGNSINPSPIDQRSLPTDAQLFVTNALIGLRPVIRWDTLDLPYDPATLIALREAMGLDDAYLPDFSAHHPFSPSTPSLPAQ